MCRTPPRVAYAHKCNLCTPTGTIELTHTHPLRPATTFPQARRRASAGVGEAARSGGQRSQPQQEQEQGPRRRRWRCAQQEQEQEQKQGAAAVQSQQEQEQGPGWQGREEQKQVAGVWAVILEVGPGCGSGLRPRGHWAVVNGGRGLHRDAHPLKRVHQHLSNLKQRPALGQLVTYQPPKHSVHGPPQHTWLTLPRGPFPRTVITLNPPTK